jgi:predicted TIM-barrel fold metal-dependent hydrolase
MNRRVFLTAAVAAAASGYTGKIIDTHVHFYDPGRPQGVPWPPSTDTLLYRRTLPDRFRQVTAGQGVTGVIVVEASPWLEDNQWLLDLAKDEPLIVGFVGRLEPGRAEFRQHLKRFSKNRLFRGIRLGGAQLKAGVASTEFVNDLRRLADADLQLDVLGNASMMTDVVSLSRRIPKLRIVIDHLPLAGMSLTEFGEHRNVYAKVSGVVPDAGYRSGLDALWEAFGPDRLVYGSNWPVSDRVAPYGTVLNMLKEYFAEKGAAAAERYFERNSKALYKWVD